MCVCEWVWYDACLLWRWRRWWWRFDDDDDVVKAMPRRQAAYSATLICRILVRGGLLRKSCTHVNIPSINIFHFRQLASALSKIDTFSVGKIICKKRRRRGENSNESKMRMPHFKHKMKMGVCVSLCALCKLLNPMSRCQYFENIETTTTTKTTAVTAQNCTRIKDYM